MRLDESRTLNPGLCRERITIQQKTVTGQDAFGADTTAPTTVATAYAQIVPLSGRELEAAQQRWSDAQFRIRLPYIDGVTTDMEIVWGTRVLDILSAEDQYGTRAVLQIVARELK